MEDGRILTPIELERAYRKGDKAEIAAWMKSEEHTTFKIEGTFDDVMTKLLGGTPKKPVRLIVRKPRRIHRSDQR